MSRRLLICFAHPDDESFGLGGVIAKYVAEGVEVSLICATSGDVGTVAPEYMKGYDSVAALRLAELDCATRVLGLKEVIKFGYRDSGMMGSADNAHPNSLWSAPLEAVAGRIAEEIRRIHPQVIITFDPYGGYGHPDHIKMHKATLAAWPMVQGDTNAPRKLYFSTFPRRLMQLYVTLIRLTGKDPRRFGANKDLDLQAIVDAILPTHARVDTKDYYQIGQQAAACHASQSNPRTASRLIQLLSGRLARYAAFTRAEPAPKQGDPFEYDLFAGIAG